MTPAGLPHSEISGSTDACSSPELIAACHVLPRLVAPRHPPYALTALGLSLILTANQKRPHQISRLLPKALYFPTPTPKFSISSLACRGEPSSIPFSRGVVKCARHAVSAGNENLGHWTGPSSPPASDRLAGGGPGAMVRRSPATGAASLRCRQVARGSRVPGDGLWVCPRELLVPRATARAT
jgi:hypothetical protein